MIREQAYTCSKHVLKELGPGVNERRVMLTSEPATLSLNHTPSLFTGPDDQAVSSYLSFTSAKGN